MKKFFLAAALSAALGIEAFCQDFPLIYPNDGPKDAISLIYGDASCLNDPRATFALVILFDEAEVVNFDRKFNVEHSYGTVDGYNKAHGESFVRDWPQDHLMMISCTARSFDKVFKSSIKAPAEGEDARYGIMIRIGQFDFGHFVALSKITDGGTITKGLVEIVDLETDKILAVFDLNYHCSKNLGYGDNDRLRAYGRRMSKQIKELVK